MSDVYTIFGYEILKNGSHYKKLEVNVVEINSNIIQIVHKIFNLDSMSYELDDTYNGAITYITMGNNNENTMYKNGVVEITGFQTGQLLIEVDGISYHIIKNNTLWEFYDPTVDKNSYVTMQAFVDLTYLLTKYETRISDLETRLTSAETRLTNGGL